METEQPGLTALKVGDLVDAVDAWDGKIISAPITPRTPKFVWFDSRPAGFCYTGPLDPARVHRRARAAAAAHLRSCEDTHRRAMRAMDDAVERLDKARLLHNQTVLDDLATPRPVQR